MDERIIRHVATVGRFLKNPSRRKRRSDHGDCARIDCLENQVKDSLKNLGCQKKQKPQPNVSL